MLHGVGANSDHDLHVCVPVWTDMGREAGGGEKAERSELEAVIPGGTSKLSADAADSTQCSGRAPGRPTAVELLRHVRADTGH